MQRLICDEMLTRLGRWLRAAGYDTLIAEPGMPDRRLLRQAIDEGRRLISRDRKLLEFKGAEGVVLLLADGDMESWAGELAERLAIDWLHRPFSRCLNCNGILQPGPGAYANQLPAYVPAEKIPTFHCPACAKAFWLGGHSERMRRRLTQWQSASANEKNES